MYSHMNMCVHTRVCMCIYSVPKWLYYKQSQITSPVFEMMNWFWQEQKHQIQKTILYGSDSGYHI